jgi:hypothetical protein
MTNFPTYQLCAGSRSVRSTTFASYASVLTDSMPLGTFLGLIALASGDDLAVGRLEVESNASNLAAGQFAHGHEVADLLRVLGNVNAVPADLTSMMMRRFIWLIALSFSCAFIVTAAAGPVVSVVACAAVLIYALAGARGDAARRAEAAEAEAAAAAAEAKAAAEAVIAQAEAVIAAARLRLLGEAGS